ncbi:substrate-binding domain-containing protein [Chromatocurvus halotolerans]|nr:substrate-binding domain-containing protein [Chromatocurvus halotolerans]
MAKRKLVCLFISLLLSVCASATSTGPVRIDGSNGARPLVAALAAAYMESHQGREVDVGVGMPSRERLAALDQDRIDLIMASHGLDEQALRAEGYDVYRFAQMPVVLAINTEGNPMEAITTSELCGVYAGEYNHWSELHGPELPVRRFARPRVEVDMEVLEARLPCFRTLTMATDVQIKERSGELAQALRDTPGAIGMTTMTRVLASQGQLRALALDGIRPDRTTLLKGDYTLMRDVFLVARPNAAQSVSDFLDFVESAGADVIIKARAMPITRAAK